MKIGLHDSDRTGFPNLALMKLSAYHKAQGDTVEWWIPMIQYDRVYSSKVFTFTPEEPMLPTDTIKGGTGYGKYDALPDDIDSMYPDYTIYPECHHAIGFLTRGCIRSCPWCVVPKKEESDHTADGKRSRGLTAGILYSWTTMFLHASTGSIKSKI